MSDDNALKTIRTTVLGFLPDAKVLLFGSRARGNYNPHSDYDILVITPHFILPEEKINWRGKIHKALVKALHAPFDVLLNSEAEIEVKKNLPGHTVRSAMKEGVFI